MDAVVELGVKLIKAEHFESESIQFRSDELQKQWTKLEVLSADKDRKLQEASEQQTFYRAVKDVDLWLEEVEKQLSSEDLGRVRITFLWN